MTNKEAIKRIKEHIAIHKYRESHAIHIVEALDMAITALQAQEAKHSTESSLTQKALDTISRRAAIKALDKQLRTTDVPVSYPGIISALTEWLNELPSAQPEPLSDAYTKAVWTWLLDYQIKAAKLKGRYTPYEVLSWVANDWRKEHERSD
jgi:hypothetical protein